MGSHANTSHNLKLIDDFRGACAVKRNSAVAGHVKRVDHDDVFDVLLFREETLTRHYFILKFDFSWGIRTNMGKTEGIFLNLQCNCHIVGSIIIKLINHRIISAVTTCPAPGQITVILCVRRAATSQPGRIAANLFVRRPEKYEAVTAYFALFVRRVSK